MGIRIAVIADFNPDSKSHVATNEAIQHSARKLGQDVRADWLHTSTLSESQFAADDQYSGIWIGPGSPYADMEGVLQVIRTARENGIPLLGTCGGFQHMVLEYARNVLGIVDAEHEESSPRAARLFITRLACSLVGRTMTIDLKRGSKLASIYGQHTPREQYLCNYGVEPALVDTLLTGGLQVSGSDAEGAMRAVELPQHPFFIGTLFLPQHTSTAEHPHPLISAFITACAVNHRSDVRRLRGKAPRDGL